MKNLWLVRHGHRIDFEDSSWSSSNTNPYDPYLSKIGINQSKETANYFREIDVQRIYCSPYFRVLQTASYISSEIGINICVEEGLGEWLNNEWFDKKPNYKSTTELNEIFKCLDLSYRSKIIPIFPETINDVNVRYKKLIDYFKQLSDKNIIIVAHGHSVIGIMNLLINRKLERVCGFCSISKITLNNNKYQLELFTSEKHLTNRTDDKMRFV